MCNKKHLTLGSLFDGSGGFPLGGKLAGIETLWASEIEPFPIAVTRKRFPNVKHYGDVSKINGAEVEPVDIITFGSPCQDLSLAGKRKGLVDGDRSSLFFQAIRLIKEMRNATRIETNGLDDGHTSPRFIVWENVFGAFSSNKGEDFKKVLEEICKVKDESVTIPRPKKWNNAGCIMGNGYSVAWRTFDAQYWGVPQRRRRIYLVADFDGECAGDILFKSEGLSRNSMESRKPWERTSKNPQDCIGTTGFDGYNGCVIGENHQPFGICSKESNSMKSDNPNSGFYKAEISKTLDLNGANPTCNQGGFAVVENNCKETPNDVSYGIERAAFNQGKNAKFDFSIEEELSPTIISKGPNAVALSKIHSTLSYADGSKGVHSQMLNNPEENFVLERQVSNNNKNGKDANVLTSSGLSFFTEVSEDVAYTLASRDYKDPPICCSSEEHYIVRRLTPTECARLQGFYDRWCDDIAVENPTEEDMEFWCNVFETHRKIISSTSRPKSDRQIKKWLANPRSDSSEYKMWGNGVALPNVYFVMNGIVEAYKNKSSNNQKV